MSKEIPNNKDIEGGNDVLPRIDNGVVPVSEDEGDYQEEIISATNQLEADLSSEAGSAMEEIISELSPEEMERMNEINSGEIKLSSETIGKLNELLNKTKQLVGEYTEKYGGFTVFMGMTIGSTVMGAIAGGFEGAVVSAGVGTTVGYVAYRVIDGLAHNHVPWDI